jgi:hypothetical protein
VRIINACGDRASDPRREWCAPSATRTRDLLLRRTFRPTVRPAPAQVRQDWGSPSLALNDCPDTLVVARMWHAYARRSQSLHRLPIPGGQGVSGMIFLIGLPQTESRSPRRTACAGPTGSAPASLALGAYSRPVPRCGPASCVPSYPATSVTVCGVPDSFTGQILWPGQGHIRADEVVSRCEFPSYRAVYERMFGLSRV